MEVASKEMEGAQKKVQIEDLSKEELVKKCKNLLVIAQKAKQAKDDAGEQIRKLTEQLGARQQGNENEKCLQLQKEMGAMQEMLATLTQQKLQFTMEMDILRKQNVALEKQMKEAAQSANELRVHANELETAIESYKRQIQRLTDENDVVIKQMDVLDMELNALKAQNTENKTDIEMKEKEAELQTLRDEVERLMEENSRNKDNMKHLYENLHKEKCEIEAESDRLRMDIQILKEELHASVKEKETIINDVKNITENNLELTRVVKTISDERDKYFQILEVLSSDKSTLDKQLKLEENRRQEIISENAKLKNEVQELFQRLENANRETSVIRNENYALKTENQCFNEKLHSLIIEREKFISVCSSTECQLQNMLQQSTAVLQDSSDGVSVSESENKDIMQNQYIATLVNTTSKLEQNLNILFSLCTGSVMYSAEEPENIKDINYNSIDSLKLMQNTDEHNINSSEHRNCLEKEIVDCDVVTRLYNELKFLNDALSDLETYGKQLECENIQLKEFINKNKDKPLDQVGTNEMQILEECQQCKEVEELRREMCRMISTKDSEEELRNEIEHCRQSLRQKNLELNFCKEELTMALSKQDFGSSIGAIGVQKCNDHDKLLEEICRLKQDYQRSRVELERLHSLLEIKNADKDRMELSEEPSKSKEDEMFLGYPSVYVNRNERMNPESETMPLVLKTKSVLSTHLHENKDSTSVIDYFISTVKQKDKGVEDIMQEPLSLKNTEESSKNKICSTKDCLDKGLQTEDSTIEQLTMALDEAKRMLSNSDKEREKDHQRFNDLERSFQDMKSNLDIADSKLLQSMVEKNSMQQTHLSLQESIEAKSKEITELKLEVEIREKKFMDAMDRSINTESLKENMKAVLKIKEAEITNLNVALKEANMKENDFRHSKEQFNSILKEKTEETKSLRTELEKLEATALETSKQMKLLRQDWEKEQKVNAEKTAELQCMKEEFEKTKLSCESNVKALELAEKQLEDLQIVLSETKDQKNFLEDKLKTLENAEKSSMEAIKELTEVRVELNSLRTSSQKQLAESSEQVVIAGQQCIEAQKLLKESNHFKDKLDKKLQYLVANLHTILSEVSKLSIMKKDLSQEILNLQNEKVWEEMQHELQQALEKYVNTQAEKKTAELLQDMQQMNELLKQRGESLSRLKESNRELEQNLQKAYFKVESLTKDLSVKTLELEEREQMVQSLECELHKMKNAQEENLHVKEQTILSLQKEVTKFMECQHELETKTSALEAKEEKIHNLEAELTKHFEKLQELKDNTEAMKLMEEEIQKLRVSDSARLVSDARVKELEDEIVALKLKIQQLERDNENGDAPSEIMSGSTISKAEESSRLRDLEETFEERYTKLRTIAVRLKKKVSELTAQLNQIETEKKRLSVDKIELQTKVTAQAKNLQTMQQEYDSLQDVVETQKSELKSLKKTLEKTVNECESVKVQLQNLEEEREKKMRELEVCMKDKHSLEAATKEMASHIQNLKKEKETENLARREKEKELKQLEEEMKLNERKLAEEIEKNKNTLEQLENMKQECKKQSVLSLEMEHYEKSLMDLTQQLAAERNKVKETENHLETQWEISQGLQEQITLLEQRVHLEETRSKEVKDQLNTAKAQLIEMQSVVSRQETSISELGAKIELQRDENESLVLQLSELAAEKQKLMDMGCSQQEALSRQIQVLEDRALHLKENLAERERELTDVKAEFENYKVRAQSVLRQKARPEDGSSTFTKEDYADELAQLRHKASLLQMRLEDASSKLQTLTVENSAFQDDRERMELRYMQLFDTVQDLRAQNSHLHDQAQNMVAEHREALKSQKLQAETLTQCYKKQLEELEERLQKETAALKHQLQLEKEQHALISANNIPSTVSSRSLGFTPIAQDVEAKMEITLLEREEGEGSESVDSTSPHLTTNMDRGTEPMPLDKLLSMPVESEESVTGVSDLREQLTLSECRSKHLASLLSEAERDLAKLTQQNQVLKEEIRRQQRSVEREQHAQNFEYLKNVVLKFITLEGGDERTHLVPVLNTLLKLSPEEVNQLNIVAKGPDLTDVARGWTSYLHRWSGAQ